MKLSLKGIFFSVRDALAWRQAVHDVNKNVTTNTGDVRGNAAPGIDKAMQLSVVFACVRMIAETIATLPLITYERKVVNGRDVRVVAREHPLYALLHDSPNADMTAVEFWESVVANLCLWGNAYVLKARTAGGKIVALDPLEPARMSVRRTLDGAVTYVYADPRGPKEYTEADIWHIKGFGTDGLCGLSPVGMGWRSMMGATNVANAASELFGDNMQIGAVVTIKELLDPTQRGQMKTKIADAAVGARTHRWALLEGGAEVKQLSMNPVDAQMVEQANLSVEDLCRWFNMPPSMIGHGTAVSNWGTGREQINLNMIQYVFRAYMVRIEQGIKKSLMTPVERLRYFSEFSVEGLLRGDSATRFAVYAQAVQNGLKTRNEVRALENDEPLPGGDELTVQSNLIPLTLLGKITNTAQNAKSVMLEWLGLTKENDVAPDKID